MLRGAPWAVAVAVAVAVVLACGCTGSGSNVDPSVCQGEVSAALQDLARAMDLHGAYTPQDRVLTATNAEDNLRGCSGAASDIAAARATTCQFLPMTLAARYPSDVSADLRRRCCPSMATGLQGWCSPDAGGM